MMKVAVAVFVFFIGASLYAQMKDRPRTEVINIHHSATPCGNVEVFRRFHVKVRGWDDIGYHFVVTNGNGGPDGAVQVGRDERLQGAHVSGKNENSLGICVVGDKKHPATKKQREALSSLLAKLCRKYKIVPSKKTIIGHHDRCPSETIGDLAPIIEEVGKQVLAVK